MCDNLGAVFATKKLFSTKRPLCFALQMICSLGTKRGAILDLAHIPGEKNIWADKFSRPHKYPHFAQGCNKLREKKVDLHKLLRNTFGKWAFLEHGH